LPHGIRSARQYEAASSRSPAFARRYEKELDLIDLAETRRREGRAATVRSAFRAAFGRNPSGSDYRHFRNEIADALEVRGGRLVVRTNDRLFRGETMPQLTPDGTCDALPGSRRQRSLIGEHWSLVAKSKPMSDEELERELRKFKGKELRVLDPESGRVVRMPFETDVGRFRQFASSSESGQERIISPRIGRGPLGGAR